METKKSMLFFSYARTDSDFALRLAKDLRSAGASIWLDQLDLSPGVPWDDAIQKALHACPALLVILSPTSVASRNVMDEVSFAIQNNKDVMPIMHRKCEIPFRLGRLNYIDFSSDYNAGFVQLRKVLALDSPNVSPGDTKPPLNLLSTLAAYISALATYISDSRSLTLTVISFIILIFVVRHSLSCNHKQINTQGPSGSHETIAAQVPNTSISDAKLIVEGETISGSLTSKNELRFFKFAAKGGKTRIIFRKRFDGTMKVLDRDEAEVAHGSAQGDDAVTLSIASTANALYFVEVGTWETDSYGDFELVVRQE
jgi:hypothetical protein